MWPMGLLFCILLPVESSLFGAVVRAADDLYVAFSNPTLECRDWYFSIYMSYADFFMYSSDGVRTAQKTHTVDSVT
jgi:hypothetical protein